MPSFHDFVEAFPDAVACAGTVTLDGVVLCEHHHGEFFVTERGQELYAGTAIQGSAEPVVEPVAEPAKKETAAQKKAREKAEAEAAADPVMADLTLPEDFE